MYLFNNNNIQFADMFGNRTNMGYYYNNQQLIGNNRMNTNQTFMNYNLGVTGYYNSVSGGNQLYIDQMAQYRQFQQYQMMFAQQKMYEYNLNLQYQYQLQQMRQSLSLNNMNNTPIYIENEGIESISLNSELLNETNNNKSFEIVILPKCDNTVTIKNVSHSELSIRKNDSNKESEVEVEIKNGDKNIELESIRDELLSEEKIDMGTNEAREIEVNVYEGDLRNENIDKIDLDLSIELDVNFNLKNEEIQDELILKNDLDRSNIGNEENKGEIEIEEDALLIIKYKNDKLGYDLLDLMERNIDNCVIDGNSYYYEDMVRSFNSNNFSSCNNNNLSMDLINNYDFNNLLIKNKSIEELEPIKRINIEEITNEEEFVDNNIQEEDNLNSNTKIEKETIEDINEKIKRFNLLLEKINRMEQMNILLKEAVLNEKRRFDERLNIQRDESLNMNGNEDNNHECDDYTSECSVLDTVKDVYDSNSAIIYNENDLECSINKKFSDEESGIESGEEQHVENYIKAINDYFAKEGLLGKCESRLNTYRWERNFQNAMNSLNKEIKEDNLDLEDDEIKDNFDSIKESSEQFDNNSIINNNLLEYNNSLTNKSDKLDKQLKMKDNNARIIDKNHNSLNITGNKIRTNYGDNIRDSYEKDHDILARLSQCRVVNSKTIRQISTDSNSTILNNNNCDGSKLMIKKNTNQINHLNNNKIIINQNKKFYPIQIKKESNLGFRSLINNGIKVNISDLMKPRVIRR